MRTKVDIAAAAAADAAAVKILSPAGTSTYIQAHQRIKWHILLLSQVA